MSGSPGVWYSRIRFQPHPSASEAESIDLGFGVELRTKSLWVVGYALRSSLEPGQIVGLDDLTRKILDKRDDVMRAEIERLLPQANEPGQVLQLLAACNPWSLSVSTPISDAALAKQLGNRDGEKAFDFVVGKVIRGADQGSVTKPVKKRAGSRASAKTSPQPHRDSPAPFYRMSRPNVAALPA